MHSRILALFQGTLAAGVFAVASCSSPRTVEPAVPAIEPTVAVAPQNEAVAAGKISQIPIEKVFELQQTEQMLLVDTRPPVFYHMGHIEGAYSFPLKSFDKKIAEVRGVLDEAVSGKKYIVIYCQSEKCVDSYKMATRLSKLGYTVSIFKGGWELWKESGLE